MNLQYLQRRQRLLPWLVLLLLAALVTYGQVAAQPTSVELVAGSYTGTVNVTEPTPLGLLDLLVEIRSTNGVLSGQVNPIKTQVFLGGPTFTGNVTTGGVVTPTVRIESQTFSGMVSGRIVQRQFVLTGDVLDDGDTLRGVYTETIVGFKPHPLLVKGTFLLVRPSGVTEIITVPTPRGTPPATPTTPDTGGPNTPTATSTVPPGNSNGPKLYLPLIQRAVAVNAATAGEETMTEGAPTITATETPTVTETPTPLVLGATTVLTTTTEAQQQIHLPLIMR